VGKTVPTSLIVLFLVPMASAQTPQVTDSRWAPWLGCWQLFDESVRERGSGRTTPQTATGVSVCVSATDEPAGVRLNTTVANQPALEQTIVADGVDHPVMDAGCRGTQRAEWSKTGRRLFARAQLVCDDQRPRKISGLTMIDGNGTWVDVQAVDVGGRESTRVRRYRQAPEQRVASSPVQSSAAALTLDDVKEATGKAGKVSPAVVEAALMATGARLALNSQRLIDLDDAGVPASVIDWMIALAYPDHFVVEREYPGSATGTFAGPFGDSFFAPWSAPYRYAPYFYGSLYPFSTYPYGFYPYGLYGIYPYDAYYYSPFAYPYSVRSFGSYVSAGGSASPTGGSSPRVTEGDARVINGVGYVRIRPREASDNADAGGGGQSRSGMTSTRAVSSGRSTSSEGSSSSTGSSGGASSGGSGGYSGGSSSSSSGGRTAEPR
jgi:hypothetical protein